MEEPAKKANGLKQCLSEGETGAVKFLPLYF